MGMWGTALYSEDTAADVRDTFKAIVRLPLTPAELRDRLVRQFGTGEDPHDDSEVDFWLALADQFHLYGLDAPDVMETARGIIASGADLSAKRDLGMSEPDLRKRAKVLEALLGKWSRPNPKPRARKMVDGPEPFSFEIGDCYAYPTMAHAGVPYTRWDFDPRTAAQTFRPNGWGAFTVLDRWHYHGFHARYLIAVSYLETADRPSPEEVLAAPIDGMRMREHNRHLETVGSVYVKSVKRELKVLHAERIGQVAVNLPALKAATFVLPNGVHGSERGDCQLGNLLCLRRKDGLVDFSRGAPCLHLTLGQFAAKPA